MRLIFAIAWAALADVVASVTLDEGLGVLQAAARVLKDARTETQTRTLKRGMPWDLGVCEPRCIEGDGFWDDCLIAVNFTKCLQHCYKWSDLADCFHCNQEVLRKDYRVYEYQLGEMCVKYLRNPTADNSWLGGDRNDSNLFTFGAAPAQTSQKMTGPPRKTISASSKVS
ncbi:hypothetical protein CspHIS471_0610700 [Cutaneotrichosporon sp. HIS471]|nr:hypothetical protein CspHIS471_0610700 [Cutaneotrichosporon sp. HIS471]